MAKFLVFVLVIAVAYLVIRNARRRPPPPAHPAAVSEDMAKCAHCATYFPRREAARTDGDEFCCEEHRRLGRRQ